MNPNIIHAHAYSCESENDDPVCLADRPTGAGHASRTLSPLEGTCSDTKAHPRGVRHTHAWQSVKEGTHWRKGPELEGEEEQERMVLC